MITGHGGNVYALSKRLGCIPAETSFFLVKLTGDLTADDVCEALARQRILIRNCSNFKGLNDQFIRVPLKGRECNQMIIDRLSTLCRNFHNNLEQRNQAHRGRAV
jgi:histidinol-phosphate/aromatic aminotransferase/cobyric acid decarboxylase-like protein